MRIPGSSKFVSPIAIYLRMFLFGILLVMGLYAQAPFTAVDDSVTAHHITTLNIRDNDDLAGQNPGIVLVTLPTHGDAQNSINSVIYDPVDGYVGADSFTYKLCAASVCSNVATVTIEVVNQAPVTNSDDFYIRSGTTKCIDVMQNDYDPEGDVIIFGLQVLTQPNSNFGVVQGGQAGTPCRLSYLSWGNFSGYQSFTYKVCDNLGACSGPTTVSLIIFGSADDLNAGSCPVRQAPARPSPDVGSPINVTTGNMWLRQHDYLLTGQGEFIEIERVYNSRLHNAGIFGNGWHTKYDESIQVFGSTYEDKVVQLNSPDGKGMLFVRENTSIPFRNLTSDIRGQINRNTDGTYSLNFKDGRIHKFTSTGKLLWQKDRNGNQTTLNYDGNGVLIGITDPFGRVLSFSRSTDQMVISDSFGTAATYEYFPTTALLKTVTYPDGSKYKFEYTTIGGLSYLTTVKDALDNILETHAYDPSGRATTSERADQQNKYTFDYSLISTGQTNVTDGLGRVTKYYFNPDLGINVISKMEGLCGCGGGGSETTTFEYDVYANLVKKTDALLNVTNYTYDSSSNLLSMTDVLGVSSFTYNSLGQVLTATDRMGGVTTNTYSSVGNLLTSKDALNNTTTFTYTSLGQPETIKDALNHTTTLTWDSQGRLTKVTDANSKETNFGYDARARVTSITNAKNEVTSLTYDLNNRVNKVTYPDANFTTFTYDLAGRWTAVTDPLSHTTNYGYDSAYRLTSVTDALNHATTFGYDLMSNLTSQTDALGNITNLEYDDFDRLEKIIYPAPSPTPSPSPTASPTPDPTRLVESMTYDKLGNIKTRVDTAGRTTTFDYDSANRLIKITDPLNQLTQFEYNARSQMTKVIDALSQQYVFTYDALGRQLSQTRAGTTMSFEYDAVGNRKKRTDHVGRISNYEFDNLNRLTKIKYDVPVSPGTPIIETTYGYDDLSRLISAANNVGTVGLTYDNRGRLKTETDVFGHVVEYGYDAANRRTLMKLDGSNYATYAYDIADRLTSTTNAADNATVTYGYDNANRMISRMFPTLVYTDYEYDGMSRLIRLKDRKTSSILDRQYSYNSANQISQMVGPWQTEVFSYDNVDRLTGVSYGYGSENYTYDSVGNRTASHLSGTYTYNPFNRLVSTQAATYLYDSNGNRISKSQGSDFWRYTWDHENRLVAAATRKQAVRYKYDALGRRVQRFLVGGKENTKFVHDGHDVVMDDNSGTLTKYQNGPGIDNKLRIQTGNDTKYILSDHLGTTDALINLDGTIIESNEYDSFGNGRPDFSTRYGFTGREYDGFTGLQYSRARWYDPYLGRFISEDPTGFGGGDANLYGYVGNNPQRFTDPSGLFPYGNWGTPGDFADWWEAKINIAQSGWGGGDLPISYNPLFGVTTFWGTLRGLADPLRVGQGIGCAIYSPDLQDYQRLEHVAADGVRAGTIFLTFAGGMQGRLGNSPGVKGPPNPYGKLGSPAHQRAVSAVADDIEARGLIPMREYRIDTPAGLKSKRFADVVAVDGNGSIVEIHQVGRTTNGGLAVARERGAILDIFNATKIPPIFHPF